MKQFKTLLARKCANLEHKAIFSIYPQNQLQSVEFIG